MEARSLHALSHIYATKSHWLQWMPFIHLVNYPFPWGDLHPVYLPHPWTQPTHQPKCHPDPISHFATIYRTDRPTDGQTDQHMVQVTKPVLTPTYALLMIVMRLMISS